MGRTQTLQIAQNEGWERLVVALVSKVVVLLPPWAVGLLLLILGAISHKRWGDPPAVTWATMASTLATVGLTALTWAVSHQRGPLGRFHSTATTAMAGLWLTVATITGVGQQVTFGMVFFGGIPLAIGWNIRVVIRQNNTESGVVDPLGSLFDRAKESFGLGGARVRTKEVTDHKIKGKMALPAGEKTQADAVKATDRIESGMRFPPGAVLIAGDKDDASQVHFTVTDPRVLDKPILWPGPSRPGGSMAEPVRVGLFQDSEPIEPVLPGNHIQIMGATGSGKSIGGTWNILAEAITRKDCAVFGVDLSKDEQTFGPLRPGMHGIHVTKPRAATFLRALHEEIPKRTKWLYEKGYTEWEEGCGLLFWVVVFEELPKTFKLLGGKGEEQIDEIAKEIRSAGGHVVMSLQKSIYSEISTVTRSQLAHMCFGVKDSNDNQYGLSEAQQKAEANPAQWGTSRPENLGKVYVDCKGIPETHIAMPGRTFAFGATPRVAAAALTAHAAQWPAAAKPMDEFTARLAALDPEGPRLGQAFPMPAGPPTHPVPAAATVDDDVEPEENGAAAELLADAADMVVAKGHVSSQMLQRAFRLSHEDCLRLMEALERRSIIGPDPGDPRVPRQVLVTTDQIAEGSTVLDDLREDGDAVADYQRTEDPDPSITAGPDDEIREPTLKEDPLHVRRPEGGKLSPEESRALLERWLRDRAASGNLRFGAGELVDVWTTAGNGRGWAYKALKELADRGVLEKTGRGFEIVDLDALDLVPAGVGVAL